MGKYRDQRLGVLSMINAGMPVIAINWSETYKQMKDIIELDFAANGYTLFRESHGIRTYKKEAS